MQLTWRRREGYGCCSAVHCPKQQLAGCMAPHQQNEASMVLCSWLPVCLSTGSDRQKPSLSPPAGLLLCVPQQRCLTVTELRGRNAHGRPHKGSLPHPRRYQKSVLGSGRFHALVCEPQSQCGVSADVPCGCSQGGGESRCHFAQSATCSRHPCPAHHGKQKQVLHRPECSMWPSSPHCLPGPGSPQRQCFNSDLASASPACS